MPDTPAKPEVKVPQTISKYKLSKLIALAHENSRSKGFWDTPFVDIDPDWLDNLMVSNKIALITSETSELLESLPEDTVEEACDITIRAFDLCGHLGFNLNYYPVVEEAQPSITEAPDEWNTAATINYILGEFTQAHRKGEGSPVLRNYLSNVVRICRWYVERRGGLFWDEVERKMDFNKGREKMHGARY